MSKSWKLCTLTTNYTSNYTQSNLFLEACEVSSRSFTVISYINVLPNLFIAENASSVRLKPGYALNFTSLGKKNFTKPIET